MIQPEQLEKFRKYSEGSGLITAENLVRGRELKTLSESLHASFSACVSSEADYTRDGIQALPAAIQTLASEYLQSANALGEWNAYLEVAATQEDMTQVSLGVEVIRLLDGVPNDTPAPSVLPISSKAEIGELDIDINVVSEAFNNLTVAAIMAEINGILVQPEPEPPEDGTPAPPVVIPPLPQETINLAKHTAIELELYFDVVADATAVIKKMVDDASAERLLAHKYFKQAVEFTIGESQTTTSNIQDGAREIYPEIIVTSIMQKSFVTR